MDKKERRQLVLRLIVKHVGEVKVPFKWASAFENLVGTILSQNTNDRNSWQAFQTLKKKVGVDPKSLSEASVNTIRRSIRSAGLYNLKAPRIKVIAKHVKNKYPQGLETLLKQSDEEVRKSLGSFLGIGDKTIDVVLAFSGKRDIVPVDTHVRRIATRLHFTAKGASYGQIRDALEESAPLNMRRETHLALLRFGRTLCTARSPKCSQCPVKELCPSRRDL
ncbi:MAG: endonuclease III [Thaumarchaeota archaeon]|nr:endonuclease III [Nitrososphaerota archaeon]